MMKSSLNHKLTFCSFGFSSSPFFFLGSFMLFFISFQTPLPSLPLFSHFQQHHPNLPLPLLFWVLFILKQYFESRSLPSSHLLLFPPSFLLSFSPLLFLSSFLLQFLFLFSSKFIKVDLILSIRPVICVQSSSIPVLQLSSTKPIKKPVFCTSSFCLFLIALTSLFSPLSSHTFFLFFFFFVPFS